MEDVNILVRMTLAVINACVTMGTFLEQMNIVVKVTRSRKDLFVSLLSGVYTCRYQ